MGSTFNYRPALHGPRYLQDLPEAIKAHPARAGAAKPTGVQDLAGLPKAGEASRDRPNGHHCLFASLS